MKSMQVNKADQGPVLILVELQKPEAGLGEILVPVHAAGVTPTELLWYPTTHYSPIQALNDLRQLYNEAWEVRSHWYWDFAPLLLL
jgi:hypothetical protein